MKQVSQNEINLTNNLQKQTWVESFALEIINNKVGLEKYVENLPIEDFKDYSGIIDYSNYLGKFFYIARYVDSHKEEYKTPILNNSPLNKAEGVEFDRKPWDLEWDDIPHLIKSHIFNHRVEIVRTLNKTFYPTINLNKKATQSDFEKDMKNIYNKLSKQNKLLLFKTNAMMGTSSPIVQSQIDNKLYIQGYLMNSLLFTEGGEDYYKTAIDNKLALLSGPSGTAHRIANLVNELKEKLIGDDETLMLKTVALCLASLGYPYYCHSFYEIITVVMPDSKELHSIEKFENALKAKEFSLC